MNTISLDGSKRKDTGKKASLESRRSDMVPCILYGGEENISFEALLSSFNHLVYTDKFFRVELSIDGEKHDAIMKEIQFHPVTDRIIHVDFQKLESGKKFKAQIPIKLEGFAEGVQEGGKLMLKMRMLNIKGSPDDIPDNITIDVTELELGKSIRVRDISIPGCQIMNSPGNPVASVVIPRLLKGGPEDEVEGTVEAGAPAKAGEEGEGADGSEGGEGQGKEK